MKMYLDEAIVNGVLSRRYSPDGEWKPLTLEQLTGRLQAAAKGIGNYFREIEIK